MTVWTKVSLDEVNVWLAGRKFDQAKEIEPIDEGVEDSVFRLVTQKGFPLFLRIFERTEPQGPVALATCLARYGLPTCAPIQDHKKRCIVTLKGKPAALYPWIQGSWVPDPSIEQIEEIGRFIGKMGFFGVEHCQSIKRNNPRGWTWFKKSLHDLATIICEEKFEELKNEVTDHITYWHSPQAATLTHGPIHADLFRNNVLWNKHGKLAAVIDWGFCASNHPVLFDLAIAANDWCLKQNSIELDSQKLEALLKGRGSVMPLSEGEQKAWPMALRWAALRFYLSRLYDYHMPRNGKKLNPDFFREMLKARKKLG